MPNLNHFAYQISSKAFDDEVLEEFISNTLPSLKKLKSFQLFLPDSKITDMSVQKLLSSFPKESLPIIKKFKASFYNTKITDKSLKTFVHETVYKFKAIEDFALYADNSLVTPYLKGKISLWTKLLCQN